MDTGDSFPGIKRLDREADHSPASSAEEKNGDAMPLLPIRLRGVGLNWLSTGRKNAMLRLQKNQFLDSSVTIVAQDSRIDNRISDRREASLVRSGYVWRAYITFKHNVVSCCNSEQLQILGSEMPQFLQHRNKYWAFRKNTKLRLTFYFVRNWCMWLLNAMYTGQEATMSWNIRYDV
jgi:hypothetical protein